MSDDEVQEDNIEAAMERVAETLKPTRSRAPKSDDAMTKQVLCRASETDHDRWKQAAEKLGVSMAEFIRVTCNDRAADLLDCQHPLSHRRWYPWSEFCLACNQRLRG